MSLCLEGKDTVTCRMQWSAIKGQKLKKPVIAQRPALEAALLTDLRIGLVLNAYQFLLAPFWSNTQANTSDEEDCCSPTASI
jgi:hypothetical protein